MSAALVAPNVDLRDFAYMPLDVLRLRDSDLSAEATDAEFRAAVMLWCAAWHQVPAASLPDNDAVLARLAGLGRDIGSWRAVREGALRSWVKCDDGRLYHPVVAEKANEAWLHKEKQRDRTAAARAARLSARHSEHGDVATKTVTTSVTDNVTSSKGTERNGTEEEIRDANASLVGEPADLVPVENARDEKKALREALRSFAEQWNSLAELHRFPIVEEIKSGSTRERQALARLREMPEGGIGALMARIRGSPYLRGEANGFRCTFDWIINASNFQKIIEGNYEDRKVAALRR